jgi:hypothetical protein
MRRNCRRIEARDSNSKLSVLNPRSSEKFRGC